MATRVESELKNGLNIIGREKNRLKNRRRIRAFRKLEHAEKWPANGGRMTQELLVTAVCLEP